MVVNPKFISSEILNQIINLVIDGGQIQHGLLKDNLLKSEYIAYIIEDDKVVTSATLKNPLKSYRDRVYQQSKSNLESLNQRELGYIVTHKEFRGKGYCTNLLNEFQEYFNNQNLFATTRKESMIHILKKYNFRIVGETYKSDLKLLIKN